MKTIFDELIPFFENEDIKEFAGKCIDSIPEYFFQVPASSSLKYHPAYACETPLGLAKHTVALVRILNHMFEVESIANQFTSRERDLLRIAGIVHDSRKSGTQEEYEHNHYTKFDHPLQAAAVVRSIGGLPKKEIELIAHAIESHMGQWNEDKRGNAVLPKPQDKYQIILHLADYLASRKEIEVKFDQAVLPRTWKPKTEEQQPTLDTWRFNFGKHNGKTIQEVLLEDSQYIKWAKENMEREPAATLLKQVDL